jgi:hypothetical protein
MMLRRGPFLRRRAKRTAYSGSGDVADLAGSGTHVFTPPGKNGQGTYGDWLLVLER